jgi:biopolymer transport protein ExbD
MYPVAGDFSSGNDDFGPINAINVTPFVDVVLVLLVIFMITAPMLMKETIGIKLPKTQSSDGKTIKTLGIAINTEGQILLNGIPVDDETLKKEVSQIVLTNPEAQAIISADKDARHGQVVHAIDLIKSSGLNHFAVQIEREKDTKENK